MVSTASRVGTGNIIGVCTAIILGGPGAIFWMWVTAIIGGANAFVESTLAQLYKKKAGDGSCYGGPSYYMQNDLGQRWLGGVAVRCLKDYTDQKARGESPVFRAANIGMEDEVDCWK